MAHQSSSGCRGGRVCVALLMTLLAGTAADAAVVVYNNQAAFQADTGAGPATGPLPNIGLIIDPGVVGGTGTVGSITFGVAPGGDYVAIGGNGVAGLPPPPDDDWYGPLAGNDIALGFENMLVIMNAPVHSMGFIVWEPDVTMPPFGGTPVDSTFKVTLFNGINPVGQFTYNNPEDVEAFVGVWSTEAFDSATIVDVTSSSFVDDDEFFGEFFTGTIQPPPGACIYRGPFSYVSAADNPFNGITWNYSYLLTFENAAEPQPGLTYSNGFYNSPNVTTDSVDADDGVIDGSGQNGGSFYVASQAVQFTFDAATLGTLPTHFSFVWTDVGLHLDGISVGGPLPVKVTALDEFGNDLGVFTFDAGDASVLGETGEDRWVGVVFPLGVSAVTIEMPDTVDWEIDHVFYAAQAAPPCTADINTDGAVNTSDLVTLLGCFGQTAPPANQACDLNCDGVVNTRDLTLFLGKFGTAC
ncbi:MAG: GC-type dockerin domain-anchored protein [Phycisphaerales bacterium]